MSCNPCEGCAFVPGTEANLEPYNRLRSEICAMTGAPFYCHDNIEWRRSSGLATRAELRKMHICEGWKREVRKHVKPGAAGRIRRLIQRAKGEHILQLVEDFIHSRGKRKARVHAELSRAILGLHAAEGFTENSIEGISR